MGYTTPATSTAGATLTASWLNTYVRDNTAVAQVCTSSTRPTGNALYEGVRIYETDTDRILIYTGSAWVRVGHTLAAGRTGAALRRANTQSIAAGGSPKNISWDTSDFQSDSFVTVNATTGTTLTIPSGVGGLYSISWQISMASGTTFSRLFGQVTVGSVNYRVVLGGSTTETIISGSVTLPLAAADTFTVDVFQNNAGATAVNLNSAYLWAYRIAA